MGGQTVRTLGGRTKCDVHEPSRAHGHLHLQDVHGAHHGISLLVGAARILNGPARIGDERTARDRRAESHGARAATSCHSLPSRLRLGAAPLASRWGSPVRSPSLPRFAAKTQEYLSDARSRGRRSFGGISAIVVGLPVAVPGAGPRASARSKRSATMTSGTACQK